MANFYFAKRRNPARSKATVTISSLDHFGQGVARYQGKTLFVAGALPGEEVDVLICEEKKQYIRGSVEQIRIVSAERQTPCCPHFGVCGGCQQQHASVVLQQQSKANALSHMLTSALGEAVPAPSIVATQAWGYRRRARFGLRFDNRLRQLQMGFRKVTSHDLVNISHCPVLEPELEVLIQPLRQCLCTLKTMSRPGHVELVLADNGPVVLIRHQGELCVSDQQKLQQFAQKYQVSLWLTADGVTLVHHSGEKPLYSVDGLRLHFGARDFIQVNRTLNQLMISQAIEWLSVKPDDNVLDLYCGVGNFTLPLARRAQHVTGIEGVTEQVAGANANAQHNNLLNTEFFLHDLDKPVINEPWSRRVYSKILLDPSRSGAAAVIPLIAKFGPQFVLYVSCNPATLARDSRALLTAGYKPQRVAMLDMFPHTGHLESMVLFSHT